MTYYVPEENLTFIGPLDRFEAIREIAFRHALTFAEVFKMAHSIVVRMLDPLHQDDILSEEPLQPWEWGGARRPRGLRSLRQPQRTTPLHGHARRPAIVGGFADHSHEADGLVALLGSQRIRRGNERALPAIG
jgi:hypothetical protein